MRPERVGAGGFGRRERRGAVRGRRRRRRLRPVRRSQRLDRALGQQLRDGAALHVDLDVRRDLDRGVLVGELRDLADDARPP